MEGIGLYQILRYTFSKRRLLILILVLAIIIGCIYTFVIKKPIYKTSALVLINNNNSSIDNILNSRSVATDGVTAKFSAEKGLITINAETKNKQSTVQNINNYIKKIEEKLKEIYDINVFRIVEEPVEPQRSSNINYLKDIITSILMGTVIFGVYIILKITTGGIISSYDVENITRSYILGEILKDNNVSYDTLNHKLTDQFKMICGKIDFIKKYNLHKTILFIGATKNVGTTFVVKNIATQYAKRYNRVLIVDTDIFSKKLSKLFGSEMEKGISNALLDNKITEVDRYIKKTDKKNIYLMPVGTANIEEEDFLSENVINLLDKLYKSFDVILIDTISLSDNVLPIGLIPNIDQTVMVVETGKTKEGEILRTKQTIENVGGSLSGIIINKYI